MTPSTSDLRVDISPFLLTYQVDPQRGFLPSSDPLTELGEGFEAWEALALNLPQLLETDEVVKEVEKLPEFPVSKLKDHQCELAFLNLCFIAHAYLHGTEPSLSALPARIAVPLVSVGARLGRPPVLSHASLILQNWRRIDPNGPLAVENLRPIYSFTGTMDEGWFYHLTTGIESIGGSIIHEIGMLLRAAKEGQEELVEECLKTISQKIPLLTAEIKRMESGCDPTLFYHRIRPFLDSLVNLTYEGIPDRPVRSYAGGSAAQSSLVQAIEAGLGISHEEGRSAAFLREMRKYMPPAHRSFLGSLGRLSPALVEMCKAHPHLEQLRKVCSAHLMDFRNSHLQLVSTFILAHMERKGPGHAGTGGTDPLPFLKQLRNDNGSFSRG